MRLCVAAAALFLFASATASIAIQIPLAQRLFLENFSAAAIERTHHIVHSNPAYVRIPYPGGDVPADTGVCTDEVIRSYRALGVDLQKEVHEDMATHPAAYPKKWHGTSQNATTKATDTNIDHRRVPNLMVFFARHGQTLPLSSDSADYQPGELVTWSLGGSITHIGIVVKQKSQLTGRYLIVHNIGAGPQMEDVLFGWKIIGHYRYTGEDAAH
jgi:uncharacterized protein YijF (DUF1287 family)